jgi:hypothetical protein
MRVAGGRSKRNAMEARIMSNQSNQGADRQNEKPAQPDMPAPTEKPAEKRKHGERKLGDDPAKEGESNESLPEGSANTHDLHSD